MNICIFKNMTSKVPAPGRLEDIVNWMRTDEKLKFFTESYRKSGDNAFKLESPLFAVACLFEGGKAMEHVKGRTGMSLVDFDDIDGVAPTDSTDNTDFSLNTNYTNYTKQRSAAEGKANNTVFKAPTDSTDCTDNTNSTTGDRLAEMKAKICRDPHTVMCYTTISGKGLRVIYRYEGDDYSAAFALGNEYYERLIGAKSDRKCKNLTRLSGIAYDPEVYFNPDAVAFSATEIAQHHQCYTKDNLRQKRIDRIQSFYDSVVKPRLDNEGVVYQPGNHNQYVMRVGYMMAQKRYARQLATEWALKMFPEYDGVEQVFKSCYDNTNANPSGPGNRSPALPFASCDNIKEMLRAMVRLRFNQITARYEFLTVLDDDIPKRKWQNLHDRHVNSIWTKMSARYRVNKMDLLNVIESDYTPAFHPFQAYLDQLPPWHEGDTDYIAELAATVKVSQPDGSCLSFCESIKKWIVGMIAGWIDEVEVNNVILVFIGRQGAYKTTWFNSLLPPELKQYFYTKTNAKRMSKDDLIALSQYGLICCEELDTMTPSELNQLKAAVTMQYVNERAAYAHYAEQRKHISTFCGTGNTMEFLNDPTGNRRWLPFEVESIRSPRTHPFNHTGIFAQAYALYRSGYRYWFTDEEIELQRYHNQHFEAPRLEQELVDLYFRKPTETENGEFVSVARAMQLVSSNVSQKLSSRKVSKAFIDLGFRRVRTTNSRGYIAIPRTGDEIKAYQVTLGLDAAADDRPF